MKTVVMPIIELDNNYYLQILDNIKNLPIDAIDIQNLKLKNIRKNRKILLKIDFTKLVPCEHLKEDHTCGAKCIGCKLFTCDYLRKKGVQFKIKDILLLDAFFDPLQKYFIKTMVFTPKEKIIKRLMHT